MTDSARYRSTIMGPDDQEEKVRRENENPGGTGRLYAQARSPTTQTRINPTHYSPPKSLPQNVFNPQTPTSLTSSTPIDRQPVSPRTTTHPTDHAPAPRDRVISSYYDPTSDSGPTRSNGHAQSPQNRDAATLTTNGEPPKYLNGNYTSPVRASFGGSTSPRGVRPSRTHQQSDQIPSQSPKMTTIASPLAVQNGLPSPVVHEAAQTPTRRAADPMSFSSILSDPAPVSTPKIPSESKKTARKVSRSSIPTSVIEDPISETTSRHSSVNKSTTPPPPRVPAKRQLNGVVKSKEVFSEAEKEIQSFMAKLDADATNLKSRELKPSTQALLYRPTKRRKLEIIDMERENQKRRRADFIMKMTAKLNQHAEAGEGRYKDIYGDEAIAAVQHNEIEAEKERKKEMQRKRRREKTVAMQIEQKEDALAKAEAADNEQDRRKHLREAERAEKKAQQTRMVLALGDKGVEIRTVSPIEPNFQGGTMTTFTAEPDGLKKGKGQGRGGARLRKSKEQKQAEKDAAEAAQAAIDAGEEPSKPPAKEEQLPKLKIKFKEPKEAREETPVVVEPFSSKSYNQIYDQIWKDIAKKEINKVSKMAIESYAIKASNLKKTAILASKEARRWQLRTNKGTKDLQARAKRIMREMMTFWKRNEREERDLRRAAERQELDNAKKAEADREANRQKRKLNFLIQQTELYSHFIGKKIKTDEVERSTDHPDVAPTNNHDSALALDVEAPTGRVDKVTNFEDLDFDADDDADLKAAAIANAQNAIQEAQDKARAFNNDRDEDGELNFTNPLMGDVQIEQPKMLMAQLKEYQLKGLNWLVNLYEQGINGILADEMGLGKTVQSISVMAYLAEKHNIWGPFLVVAPASTLHNWQQEITKFVPTLKVLPYWGTAADRKVLRKFWDRKHITYTQDAPFHVLITSYQLVVSDVAYFQKMRWQYMILDEAQAIKSSQSSRWKSLLNFHCRNRLLLTGTPIQNNMQELWALLHFIMPSLFDSHDEFSEWFSKDIESHAQSNTKLNEDQLKRLHMILKPFMLRRVKKHVQKELGDKIELDLYCDLTYRQRAYYGNLRNQISIMDLIEKATLGDDNDSSTLMNLVMQFRKVCNHPDLFERAETTSSFSFAYFAETGSFMREGPLINVSYSTRNMIEYALPRLIWREGGRLNLPGRDNQTAGFRRKWLEEELNIYKPRHTKDSQAFSWLRLADTSPSEVASASKKDLFGRAVDLVKKPRTLEKFQVIYDEDLENIAPTPSMLRIVERGSRRALADVTTEGYLGKLFNVAQNTFANSGMSRMEQCGRAGASAPPIEISCSSRATSFEKQDVLFNVPMRRALYGPSLQDEKVLVESKIPPYLYPQTKMLPEPTSEKQRFTDILVPSMRRFVTDSGKLAKLDELLIKLKSEGHRVLLYFQMTRMIDLMEEYLTYRNYKYLRLDGSTKLEDRRDTVHDFQTRPDIFIFLLSTRAGGLGINLTSADTVIFYDSDWNPTIDSQAMDRAHRLGQTKQVTVYRMITRGTIEERIRKRALQKEEVQRVVISGGSGGGVDFNTRSKENRTKDVAMWLVDDEQAAEIERKAAEAAEAEAAAAENGAAVRATKKKGGRKRKAEAASLDDMYHEGEGHFDDGSNKPSGAATPIDGGASEANGGRGSLKAKKMKFPKGKKTTKQKLLMADGGVDIDMMDGDMD